MKGQYRIVMEVMLFAIGVAITSFVLVNFQDLQKNTDTASIKNQMGTVLNSVLNGVEKAWLSPKSIVRVDIPTTLSGRTYRLFVENRKNLTIADLRDSSVNASREIFNIDESNIVAGEVVSAAGIVEITNDGSRIIIQRG